MNKTIRRVTIAAIAAGITWPATASAVAVISAGPDGSLIAQVSSLFCPSAGNCGLQPEVAV